MTFQMIAAVCNPAMDWTLSALFIILTIATVAVTVWFLVKNINKDASSLPVSAGKLGVGAILAIIVVAGALIRVALSFLSAGNRSELYVILEAANEWSERGASEYIRRFYSDLTSSATGRFLYPLTFYYVGLTAGSMISAGIESSSVMVCLVIKLPLIIADAVTALVVYKIAEKYRNKQVALILAAFVSFCPLFVFASAIWTSVFSVLACLLAISFYALVEKKHVVSIVAYAVSLLVAKEASYLFPLYLVYYVYTWLKSLKNGDRITAVALPVTTILCIAVQYLVCLPLTAKKYSGEFFSTINVIFLYPLTQLNRYSDNALSIYNIFMRGGALTNVLFRSQQSIYFIVAFALIAASVTAVVYFGRKNRAILTIVASFILMLYQSAYFDMTPTAMIPSLVLLIMAFALVKEKRLLKILFGESILVMAITALVYVSAGYYNYLPIDAFTSASYDGYSQLVTSLWGKICAVSLSVLSIGMLAYFTKVLIDIAMSDKVCPLGGKDDMSFTSSLKYFLQK